MSGKSKKLQTDKKGKTNTLVDILNKRINNRQSSLSTIQTAIIDNVPDEVKKMREIEAGKLRAIIEEQKDMVEIIKSMGLK